MHQLAFHPAVRQHHHGDDGPTVHGDQFKPAHGGGGGMIRHGIGGIVHKGGHHLAGFGDHLIGSLQFLPQGIVDLGSLLVGKGLALHQLVDVQPVAFGRRDTAGAGMGLLQIAHVAQFRQFVADGGGADLFRHPLRDGLGAKRLGGVDIAFHHDLQYLLFSRCQFHSTSPFSTPFL